MSAVLVSKEKNRAVFTVEISQEDFEKSIKRAYEKNKRYFSIPGFRKGKAPRKIIESNYGQEIFFEDALNDVLPQAYETAIEDLELEPVDQPQVDVGDIDRTKPIQVKFEVDIKPVPILGDYTNGLELEEIHYEVKEDDVSREIEKALESNARMVTVEDRSASLGDTVTIDYEGFKDGEPFEGGKAEGYDLELGSGAFIPGFEDQLVGTNTGEEKEITVVFPEEYHSEDLKGAEAVFKVKLHSIKEKQLPELDDEFAKDVSDFDTLEEYKNDVRSNLEKAMEQRKKVETENRAMEKLVEISEIDVPESMIRNQVDHEVQDFAQRLQQMGLTLESYYQFANATEESLREQMRETAQNKVMSDLALEALVLAENIEVEEEEIEEELRVLAKVYQAPDEDKFVEEMKNGDGVEFVKESVKKKKAVEKLVEYVKFVEKEPETQEEIPEEQQDDTSEES